MIDLRGLLRGGLAFGAASLLGACASSGPTFIPSGPPQSARPAPQQTTPQATPPPVRPSRPAPTVSSSGLRTPQIMRAPGLETVIGASARQLERRFGSPRLRVQEGDALKLQFSGEPCVLDVYLYPMRRGAAPSATHVEARRASDGRPVDRASCVEALRRS